MSEDSKKIKLISWNIQKSTDGVENPETKSEVIKSFLKSDTNTIIVLQEATDDFMTDELIPCLILDESYEITFEFFEENKGGTHNNIELKEPIKENYNQKKDDIKDNINKHKIEISLGDEKKITIYPGRNVNNKDPKFRTVVIKNLEQDLNFSFERVENKEIDYKNRYVKIELKEEGKTFLSILGLHAKDAEVLGNWLENETETILELKEEDKKYKVTKNEKIYYKPDIMIGDFNSGNYIRKNNDSGIEINRAAYQKVSTGYIDVCQGMYTKQGSEDTQIDHILIKNSKEVWDKIEVKNPSCGYKEVLGDKENIKNNLTENIKNNLTKNIEGEIENIEGKIKNIYKIEEIKEKMKKIIVIKGKIEGEIEEEIKEKIEGIEIEITEKFINKLSDHLPISCDIIFK